MKSQNGNVTWKKNKWVKVKGELEMCKNGLHSSIEPYDAFSYVQGEILALVECRGEHLEEDNKFCWEEQRVIKTCRWTKKDSVRLAIYSAEQCLKNYESEYPKDLRPRKAIQATKKWLKTGSKKGLSAARSAARSAAESARSAAESAWSAWSAWSAAESAAWSARSAAESAWSAWLAARSAAESAWSAASSAAIIKIQKYFKKIVKEKGL